MGPSCLCLATNAQDENDKLQLFPASDEVLLKYHPPLIKTKGQEETNYYVIYIQELTLTSMLHCPLHPHLVVPKKSDMLNLSYFVKPTLTDGHYSVLKNII